MNKLYPRLLFLMIGALGFLPSLSQDGHYWTQQYGTRSMLLSGSAIGGVDDLGAVFYNPGRLAVISNDAFLLSANVYEYNSLSIANATGDKTNVSQTSIRGVPTLAAGTFKVKFLPKHHFAYAIMTRQSSDLSFSLRDEQENVTLANGVPLSNFGGEVQYIQKSTETWAGLTWSYALSSKVSVGVTTNYSTNSQAKGAHINMQALYQPDPATNEVGVYRYNRSIDFKQNGFIWKAGLAYAVGDWRLGLTVTTPVLNLPGTGNYQYEEFFSSIPALNKIESYSSSYQNGLKATYKTPWSIGMGISRNFGRNKVHFSTEFFSSIPKYTIMQAADHPSQSDPANIIQFTLMDQIRGLWNAGLGTEFYLSEKISGFASVSTDYAASAGTIARFAERKSEAANTGWVTDFYHLGGGIVLKLKGADVTLGGTHTGANQTVQRLVNFPDSGNSNAPIFDSSKTADLRWDRWRVVFSFSFPFLKNYTDKLSGEKSGK